MHYPLCEMVPIKDPLLLIERCIPCCGGSGFPLSVKSSPLQEEWFVYLLSFGIYLFLFYLLNFIFYLIPYSIFFINGYIGVRNILFIR